MKTRITICLLVLLLALLCGCGAPAYDTSTCTGAETYRCATAEAAVSLTGLCGAMCQARCRAYAEDVCR